MDPWRAHALPSAQFEVCHLVQLSPKVSRKFSANTISFWFENNTIVLDLIKCFRYIKEHSSDLAPFIE